MRTTIGSFIYKNRKHNIYIARGYSKNKHSICVGNMSLGKFFRFNVKTGETWVSIKLREKVKNDISCKGKYKWVGLNVLKKIDWPESDNDVEELVSKALKTKDIHPDKLNSIEVEPLSRRKIIGNIVAEEL